jgi:hypothetical protein
MNWKFLKRFSPVCQTLNDFFLFAPGLFIACFFYPLAAFIRWAICLKN